jgi:N-acetylglucosamine kinase-like BadF-type ATPase
MSYFLALDAGGTKTDALLADESRVLARGSADTIKLLRTTPEEAEARLSALLEELSAKAGVPLSKITRTCMGIAGFSTGLVSRWSQQTLARHVSGEILLCGDEEIALDAVFPGTPGILVIAGTGSNVIGRCSNGSLHGAGGWGPVLGDEGSGYWIGIEAVRSALRAQDRHVNSCMLADIQKHWGLDSLQDLVAMANRQPAPDFASLARVVAECAAGGDALAQSVLQRAGEELAGFVTLVHSKMQAAECEEPATTETSLGVAYTGSVLTHIAPVRAAMAAALKSAMPTAKILDTPVEPLEGALWRARRA